MQSIYLRLRLATTYESPILGAGAVGGLIGAVLAHEGEDVALLVRPENQGGYPGKLKLNTPKGAMESPVRIETKLTDDVDVLWVAVKTYELIGALSAVPSESNIGTIIPLLNGIDHVDLLRVRFGHDNVVPATDCGGSGACCRWSDRAAFSICSPGALHARARKTGECRRSASAWWFYLNFKLTRKPCCGASSLFWDRLR